MTITRAEIEDRDVIPTLTIDLSREEGESFLRVGEEIRQEAAKVELAVTKEVERGNSPFADTSRVWKDPRIQEQLRRRGFVEIRDAFLRGYRAAIFPLCESNEKGVRILLVTTYVSRTYIGIDEARPIFERVGEVGERILEKLKAGYKVILNPLKTDEVSPSGS